MIKIGLIFGDPVFHIPFDILLGFLAFIHQRILLVDIIKREGEDFEKLLGRRLDAMVEMRRASA